MQQKVTARVCRQELVLCKTACTYMLVSLLFDSNNTTHAHLKCCSNNTKNKRNFSNELFTLRRTTEIDTSTMPSLPKAVIVIVQKWISRCQLVVPRQGVGVASIRCGRSRELAPQGGLDGFEFPVLCLLPGAVESRSRHRSIMRDGIAQGHQSPKSTELATVVHCCSQIAMAR